MTRRNRLRYRRRRRGQNPVLTIVLTAGVTLFLILLIFLIVGNVLHSRNQKENQTEPDAPSTEESDNSASHADIRSIRAPSVAVQTAGTDTFSDRLATLRLTGYSEASVPLNTSEGRLLYASALGETLGFSFESGRVATADDLAQTAKEAGVYLSGVYYLTAFSQEDDLLRAVSLSRSAALLAELFRAGWQDVVLLVPDFSVAQTEELLRFAEEVHALAPEGTLGVALPSAYYAADNAAGIEQIYHGMDFLALDTGAATEAEDLLAALGDLICSPDIRYHILHYGVRILLPAATDSVSESEIIAVAEEEKFNHWQFLP